MGEPQIINEEMAPSCPPTRRFRTLDSLSLKNKTVLVRLDLNVPMRQGKITDHTRITRTIPTLRHLIAAGARTVVLSHFDRPKGKFDPSMSLAPLVDALSEALGGHEVKFAPDCMGHHTEEAVAALKSGEVILLENLRFYPGEEGNDPAFADAIAKLGDIYVNDAFSCSHRAHASVVGLAERLPAAAGRLMQEELDALCAIMETPEKPVAAVVGGSKVSTKLELLDNLVEKMDVLVIGGGMANTFLYAQGYEVGASLCEREMKDTASAILNKAARNGCRVVLPEDAVTAHALAPNQPTGVHPLSRIPADGMILDIGPASIASILKALSACKSIVWNGPVGAFETAPFDAGTIMVARIIAGLSTNLRLKTIAGGGDTVAALAHAGVTHHLGYVSTAGGAFLEWLEGKSLPGVKALEDAA